MQWARPGRRVGQMLLGWLRKARHAAARRPSLPVPPGHVPIVVGETLRKYCVPTSYLSHKLFEELFSEAEEYNYPVNGPLRLPCDEARFEDVLRRVDAAQTLPPVGHVPIVVGDGLRKYFVPTKYLNHDLIKALLSEAEEVYEFSVNGPPRLPCDEARFEEVLRAVSVDMLVNPVDKWRCVCPVMAAKRLDNRVDDSTPLLRPVHSVVTI